VSGDLFDLETVAGVVFTDLEPEKVVDRVYHLQPSELDGEGSVMVKDETICIRCGLCAERCPAHTITMEAFEVFDREPGLVSIEGVALRP
jgi:ferredoxin